MNDQPTRSIVPDGKMTLTLEVAEDGGYFVSSLFDPEIITQAETVEEAFEMARDVVAFYKQIRDTGLLPQTGMKKASTTKSMRPTTARMKAS